MSNNMQSDNNIKVSVVCITYNQERYIRDAMEGFLMQKTNFNFEILIHDDASTDSTAEIVKTYQKKYPDRIRTILQKENQHSQHKSTLGIIIGEAKGTYLAICEGDDYWTDPYKLQKQYDAMQAHPECDICAHTASMVDADSKAVLSQIDPLGRDGIISLEDVISGGGNYVATASLFMTRDCWDNRKEFVKMAPYDYCIQMNGAIRGGMLYLKDNMACYRRGAQNSWTLQMKEDKDRHIQHMRLMMKVLDVLNQETDGKFEKRIKYEIQKYKFNIARLNRNSKLIYSKKYRKIRRSLSRKDQLIVFLECFCPPALSALVGAKKLYYKVFKR